MSDDGDAPRDDDQRSISRRAVLAALGVGAGAGIFGLYASSTSDTDQSLVDPFIQDNELRQELISTASNSPEYQQFRSHLEQQRNLQFSENFVLNYPEAASAERGVVSVFTNGDSVGGAIHAATEADTVADVVCKIEERTDTGKQLRELGLTEDSVETQDIYEFQYTDRDLTLDREGLLGNTTPIEQRGQIIEAGSVVGQQPVSQDLQVTQDNSTLTPPTDTAEPPAGTQLNSLKCRGCIWLAAVACKVADSPFCTSIVSAACAPLGKVGFPCNFAAEALCSLLGSVPCNEVVYFNACVAIRLCANPGSGTGQTDTGIWTSYRSGSGRRNASGGQGPTTENVPTSRWTVNGALPFGITDARQPVIVGDAVIMPFQDKLARLDPAGNEQWTTDDGPASAIVTDGETVYAIWGGALRAIDITTGEQQWRFGLAADSGLGQILLALAGDQIVRLQDGDFNARVWGHSTSDGSELWSQELERSYSGLATSNSRIFALSRSGSAFDDNPGGLITLDLDGTEQWRNEEVISPPVIVDEAGNTYADTGGTLSAGTVPTLKLGPGGTVQWQVEDGGQPWALRNGVLYTVTRDRVYARAASDGSELWNYEFEATRVVAAQDWVYAVNLGTGRVLALSGDGERQWIQEVGDGTAASLATPVPAHNQLYVPTSSGLSTFQ